MILFRYHFCKHVYYTLYQYNTYTGGDNASHFGYILLIDHVTKALSLQGVKIPIKEMLFIKLIAETAWKNVLNFYRLNNNAGFAKKNCVYLFKF